MAGPLRLRLSPGEVARVAPQIDGAVKKHAADNTGLVKLGAEVATLGGKIGGFARPALTSLLAADQDRDELVRALALGIEAVTHRIDQPARRDAALRLEAALVGDGYTWVHGPMGVESARIRTLLDTAARPEIAADLKTVGLTDGVEAVDHYQETYLDVERGRGAAASAGVEYTQEQRKLLATFNRKLDRYVAQVNDEYPADGPERERNIALLQPIVQATGRDRSQDGPRGGGAGGTGGTGGTGGGGTTPGGTTGATGGGKGTP